MMRNKKFVFAGNRFYVLEQMLLRELNLVHILAVRGSYLQRVLEQKGVEFTVVESKGQLIETIEATDFDYFVANGCPYILPITQLSTGEKKFVNVHPSALPDLRGADPVPGALLHERDAGATCHVMDDGIDTGGIIARVVIPNTPDLECGLLYQLSFLAEAEVFQRERGGLPLRDLTVDPTRHGVPQARVDRRRPVACRARPDPVAPPRGMNGAELLEKGPGFLSGCLSTLGPEEPEDGEVPGDEDRGAWPSAIRRNASV